MFPNTFTLLIFVFIAVLIAIIGYLLPKVSGAVAEIIAGLSVFAYLFIVFPFSDAVMLISFSAMTYGYVGTLLEKDKRKKQSELKQKIATSDYQIISQKKVYKRIIVDLLLTVCVSTGAIIFFVFAPATYAVLKLFVGFGLIVVLTQMVERIGDFFTSKLYWLPTEERLAILSTFQPRDFPLHDLKEIKRESTPDLLKLHPLFTFLSANRDYTSSFQTVLRLSFPGENIYITPHEVDKWQHVFENYEHNDQEKRMKEILPLWHPLTWKRLFWKGYFAVTVKGISAYTGLIFLLIWLEVPSYVMIGFVFLWWMFNLYVSDRVLIAGTDAEPVTEREILHRAQAIFNKAGIPHTKLYMIDSPIHNGLATGMNIGRGTVMLTKATMELPIHAIEAILAHEAIHIKNRDVLTNQLGRMMFMGLIVGFVYLFYDQIILLADHLFIFIPLVYVFMMAFPIYLSLVAQWTEVRADYFGAKLLEDGREQMAAGLLALGAAQDQAQSKTLEYSTNEAKPLNNTLSAERGKWFFRVIEFQIELHPPLYFRIRSLSNPLSWRNARKDWFIARLKESLPDFLRKGN